MLFAFPFEIVCHIVTFLTCSDKLSSRLSCSLLRDAVDFHVFDPFLIIIHFRRLFQPIDDDAFFKKTADSRSFCVRYANIGTFDLHQTNTESFLSFFSFGSQKAVLKLDGSVSSFVQSSSITYPVCMHRKYIINFLFCQGQEIFCLHHLVFEFVDKKLSVKIQESPKLLLTETLRFFHQNNVPDKPSLLRFGFLEKPFEGCFVLEIFSQNIHISHYNEFCSITDKYVFFAPHNYYLYPKSTHISSFFKVNLYYCIPFVFNEPARNGFVAFWPFLKKMVSFSVLHPPLAPFFMRSIHNSFVKTNRIYMCFVNNWNTVKILSFDPIDERFRLHWESKGDLFELSQLFDLSSIWDHNSKKLIQIDPVGKIEQCKDIISFKVFAMGQIIKTATLSEIQ